MLEKDMVEIKVARGETVNIGNYESSKIEISLTAICKEKDIDAKYEEIEGWIYDKINEEIKVLKGE